MKSYSLLRRILALPLGCPPLRNLRVTFSTSLIFVATSQFFWIHIGKVSRRLGLWSLAFGLRLLIVLAAEARRPKTKALRPQTIRFCLSNPRLLICRALFGNQYETSSSLS